MMAQPQPQKNLFSYHINFDHRVGPDHPLRQIKAAIDFTFVRAQIAHCYGYNGNE
jgi:transposase